MLQACILQVVWEKQASLEERSMSVLVPVLTGILAMQGVGSAEPAPRKAPPPTVRVAEIPRPAMEISRPAEPKPEPNRPVAPVGDPARWVSSYDYPASAREEGRAGETKVMLTVNRWGRVADCSVVSSSGHKDLDSAACQKAVERARFYPALDADLQPISSTYDFTVAWTGPSDPPRPVAVMAVPPGYGMSYPSPPSYYMPTQRLSSFDEYPAEALAAEAEGSARLQISIDRAGTVSDCKVLESSGNTSLDSASCELAYLTKASKPAQDVDGKPTAGRVERSVRWTIAKPRAEVAVPTPYVPRPRPFPFQKSGKAGFVATVTKEGNFVDCEEVAEGALAEKNEFKGFCTNTPFGTKVDPFKGPDGEPVAKTVSFSMSVEVEDAGEEPETED